MAVNTAIAKTQKQPKCPLIEEWVKTWHIHTVKCHSAIKENEIASLDRMEPEIATLTEVGQTEKGKYHMTFLVCGSKKKLYKRTYLQDRMRLTDLQNKLMVARGEKNRRGVDRDLGNQHVLGQTSGEGGDREAWHDAVHGVAES